VNTKTTAAIIALTLGLLATVSLAGPCRSDAPDSAVGGAGSPAPKPDIGQDLPKGVEVTRSGAGSSDPTSLALVPWRNASDSLVAEFLAEYDRFSREVGEAFMVDYMNKRARAAEGGPMEDYAVSRLAILHDHGLPASSETSTRFQGLVYAGDMHAGNLLTQQVLAYDEWVENRDEETYRFPENRMSDVPLEFPPEMWADVFAKDELRVESGAELAARLNELRNSAVERHALLEQEAFQMTYSLNESARKVGIAVEPQEWIDAFSDLHPVYAGIREDMRQIELQYISDIRALLRSHGYEVNDL